VRGTKRHERETDEANRLMEILRDAGRVEDAYERVRQGGD
jgi:hypothetical protein